MYFDQSAPEIICDFKTMAMISSTSMDICSDIDGVIRGIPKHGGFEHVVSHCVLSLNIVFSLIIPHH